MGNLLLEACYLELEIGNLELDAWCAGAGCRVPGAGAGCRVPGAGCRVPGAGCRDFTTILTSCQVILYSKQINFRISGPPDGTTAK